VAQVNPSMPVMSDAPSVRAEAVDYLIEIDEALVAATPPRLDQRMRCIAQYAAGLVDDGDTIQYGVGNMPQAVVAQLGDHRELGLHTGLAGEAVRPLIDAGVMTGSRKRRDTARHVAGVLYGDAGFYDWAARRSDFSMRPVSYTHALDTLRSIDNLVAINSALEVDLFGQANAEMAGSRQISGSGGLVDFIRGARASRGGRAMVCLPAASRDGLRSNITMRLTGIATVPRTDIDIVVTEYGVARLRHLCAERRAEALIAVAAPPFRKQLEQDWADI
jgi:4-hydroxybutyrate CoA-transferase